MGAGGQAGRVQEGLKQGFLGQPPSPLSKHSAHASRGKAAGSRSSACPLASMLPHPPGLEGPRKETGLSSPHTCSLEVWG